MFQTYNSEDFLNAIGQLIPRGGGDCPEPSIGALIRAIRASEPNSPIYVYTDAPPSDPNRLAEVEALISEKGVTVSYGLNTGDIKVIVGRPYQPYMQQSQETCWNAIQAVLHLG